MSKLLITILDKFVCVLLLTALTTQALQSAGIIQSPKGLGEINYEKSDYDFGISVQDEDLREKRHTETHAPMVNSIMNLPLATVQALRNFLRSAKTANENLHEIAETKLRQAHETTEDEFLLKPFKRRLTLANIMQQNIRNQ